MRITTNQMLRNYQSNLSKTNYELNSNREKVLTQRNFNRISEDPSGASKSFKLRKQYLQNEDYIENVNSVISHFDAVESSAMQMNDIMKEANALILEGIDGSAGLEKRKTIATSLRKMQESLVLSANAKFGDTFILAGEHTDTIPFELKNGKLYYLGNDVSSDDPDVQKKLDELSKGEILVDLGFGLTSNAGGGIVANSAFNTAFSGLNVLGFGKNADGVDKNVVNLLGQIADELEKPDLDEAKIKGLTDQFDDSKNEMMDFVTVLGTKSKFLEETKNRLTDNKLTLNEKIVSLENVDLAEAITNYSWSQFAYNAALKVGNSILSQSFIDFMR